MQSKLFSFSALQWLLASCCFMSPLAHASFPMHTRWTGTTGGERQPVFFRASQAQGLSTEHMATSLRRRHLTPQAQLECAALDSQLPIFKRHARRAPPEKKQEARDRLQQALIRFAHLRC